MLINEVVKKTKLTKKAVEYYTEKGVVVPEILENSYRDYSEEDVLLLKKIKVLRNLGLSLSESKEVLSGSDEAVFHKIIASKEIELEISQKRAELLSKLSDGLSYEKLEEELSILARRESISERLVSLFPGYFGKLLRYQFGEFLAEPIRTKEQERAYNNIIEFLDNMPTFEVDKELEEYIEETAKGISNSDLREMMHKRINPMYNIEEFLSENDEMIREYLNYRESDEFKNSKANRVNELFKQFMSTSGFRDVFILNMREMSSSYNDYYERLLKANEVFIEKYNVEEL